MSRDQRVQYRQLSDPCMHCWPIIDWLLLLISGLVLYFAYGMHNSREKSASSYGQMVMYGGEADISSNTITKLDEEVVHQQPERKNETFGGLWSVKWKSWRLCPGKPSSFYNHSRSLSHLSMKTACQFIQCKSLGLIKGDGYAYIGSFSECIWLLCLLE